MKCQDKTNGAGQLVPERANMTNPTTTLIERSSALPLTGERGEGLGEGPDGLPEQWRPVAGYPRYEVSNMGRVRSIRTLKDKQGVAHKVRFVLKPCVRNKSHWKSRRCKQRYANYLSVRLCRNGERTSILVHALVAQAFIGPRPEGLVTDHINGDKYDNRAANLQYITNRENVIKGVCEHGSRSNFYRYKVVVSGLPDFSFKSRSVSEISRQVKLNRGTLKWALWRKGIYQKNGITVTREKL